ncbi:hypothetical protein BDQ94DRAFT_72699 [Aspergillus welwitschiae]|uniref:Uncharacterized protein n=1 Tax=Aspergillus welwitschiae TaxID=1341132 RepID=A0A3F3QG00_9EURO|nr:hypothetical protein BDQ94DRAFT_72699 [Aspergillus welwitschiae]RDH38035.1 hypothetical protein BDQ94DRAFT_72699 [Aspergillus welwitschiae]
MDGLSSLYQHGRIDIYPVVCSTTWSPFGLHSSMSCLMLLRFLLFRIYPKLMFSLALPLPCVVSLAGLKFLAFMSTYWKPITCPCLHGPLPFYCVSVALGLGPTKLRCSRKTLVALFRSGQPSD